MTARRRGEVDRVQALSGPGLATADDCDDGEEVSRVGLRYPKHLISCTITLAHTLTPSHTVRCLDRSTAGDCIGRAVLSGFKVAVSKAHGRACGRGGMGKHRRRTRRRLRLENAVTRIAGERASARRQASATYIYIKDPGGSMGGPCGFRIPMTRPVCARGAPKRRPSMHGAYPKRSRHLTLETSSPSSQSSAVASPGPAKCCARSTSPLCHAVI